MRRAVETSMSQETEVYCFSEIYRSVHRMSRALFKLKKSPGRVEFAVSILKMAHKIRDFAMIHGYEGVENVACHFCRQFEAHSRTHPVVTRENLLKIESWILSIKRMVEIEECEENNTTIETISNTLKREKLTVSLPFQERPGDSQPVEGFQPQRPQSNGHGQIQFEIREYDELLQVDEFGKPHSRQ